MFRSKTLKWRSLLLTFSLLAQSSLTIAADPAAGLRFITEESPPYNYTENGQLKGSSVDLLEAVLQIIGSKQTRKDIQVHPWARGYRMVLNEPNTMLFSTRRNPDREDLFRWVGPVATSPVVLMARKRRDFEVKQLSDLGDLSVVAVASDMGEQVLDAYHIPKDIRQTVSHPDIAARMLIFRRIHMWSYGQRTALWLLKQQGAKVEDYEPVWSFGSAGDLYFAFHKDTPEETIQLFQHVLDQLKNDPGDDGLSTYERVLKSYVE
ncbi:transporter substrate-binding domain-containing protein [Hahella sp. KA22]|uniref:substrate-binding periplasmic protein n=1 Tax=Hahella sp. KA22 TaxID=1628392 RepID=UPI000FDEFAC1|nr:ABC transporter substrate-binding protein [Hahella sp. KA22]AZZ94226.1 ABC transporter substrate-binding protein [Hahella sp. KA22]QAY57600.1 transporter substrate-binding domain-containing protein [Hahella sp. KA22]